MRNLIDTRVVVYNSARRFGEAQHYIPVRVFDESGWRDGLLTHAEVLDAVKRAERQPEDVPPVTRRERAMRCTHQALARALDTLRRMRLW